MNVRYNSGISMGLLTYGTLNRKSLKNQEKLSSGYRINRAADDAAGLAISERMRRMIRGLKQSSYNAQDGISLLQTAEGAMNETSNMLQRMNELIIHASNGTNSLQERESIQEELAQIITQIDQIGNETTFNSLKLLDGSLSTASAGTTTTTTNPSMHIAINYAPAAGTSSPTGLTGAAWEDDLLKQIVPGAVAKIFSAFPVFNQIAANGGISNSIGLNIFDNSNQSVLAYVSLQYTDAVTFPVVQVDKNSIQLSLGVNTAYLGFDFSGNLVPNSRLQLEGTIVHEMMHAFMFDACINGMMGVDKDGYKVDESRFPTWFYEGMAQTVWGAGDNTNDFLARGLGLTEQSSLQEIKAALSTFKGSIGAPGYGNDMVAQYGTGYLACMYLGYMAAGKPTNYTPADIARGLNDVLTKIIDGYSMDKVLNEVSNGQFTSNMNYQENFAKTDEIINFIQGLLIKIGSTGNGSVLTSSFSDFDLIEDQDFAANYYQVDTQNQSVVSSANTNRDWGTGMRTQDGANYTGSANPPVNPNPGGGGSSGNIPSKTGGLNLFVGVDSSSDILISIDDIRAAALGIQDISVTTEEGCQKSLEAVKNAIIKLSAVRSSAGAATNRLEHTINNLENIVENTQAAESRIRDMDMASGMVTQSVHNILANATAAIISQSLKMQENILALLQ